MSSFENVPDDEVLRETLLDPTVTGGEEDPEFVASKLDRILEVNRPQQKPEETVAGDNTGDEHVEYKQAA